MVKAIDDTKSNSYKAEHFGLGASKLENAHDAEESLDEDEDEVGRSCRASLFSSTPWPLQRGQELRPVVSH